MLLAAPAVAGTFRWDLPVDLPVTLAAAGAWATLAWEVEPRVALRDEGASPRSLDRLAPDRLDPGISRASDIVVLGSMGLGLGATAASAWLDHDRPFARVALWGEAFALNALATEGLKLLVRRPRPYTAVTEAGTVDDDLSFPSGHTSFTAVTTFAAARTIDLAGARPTVRVAAYASAGALTATVATLRVTAGKHFPTDTLAGALLGGGLGVLVPSLHRGDVAVTALPGGVAVTGRW